MFVACLYLTVIVDYFVLKKITEKSFHLLQNIYVYNFPVHINAWVNWKYS